QSFDAAALRAGLRPALLRVFAEAGGYAGGLDAPMGVATRPGSDRIYVADTRGHRIVEFGPGGRSTGLVFGRPGPGPGEPGRAANRGGRPGRAGRPARPGLRGRGGAGPGEFQYPQSIAADSRGRVYVCDRLDGRCQIFTGDGRFIGAFGEEWQPPEWTAPARE